MRPAVLLAICATALTASASARASATVWLCRPGLVHNPCASDQSASVVGASGTFRAAPREPLANSPVDCFYVYPTVSHQQTVNANLKIDPEERDVAVAQASRFSSACRMYAPMYPQLTLHAIFTPGAINLVSAATAYAGVLTAFRDYLARYNHGRGIVFIGHSQGAAVLIALLRNEVDKQPTLRRRTGPRWGLHIYDVQLALGDLVRLVSAEAAAYRRPAGRR